MTSMNTMNTQKKSQIIMGDTQNKRAVRAQRYNLLVNNIKSGKFQNGKTKACNNVRLEGNRYTTCTRPYCTYAHSINELNTMICRYGKKCRHKYSERVCTFKHPDENEIEWLARAQIRLPQETAPFEPSGPRRKKSPVHTDVRGEKFVIPIDSSSDEESEEESDEESDEESEEESKEESEEESKEESKKEYTTSDEDTTSSEDMDTTSDEDTTSSEDMDTFPVRRLWGSMHKEMDCDDTEESNQITQTNTSDTLEEQQEATNETEGATNETEGATNETEEATNETEGATNETSGMINGQHLIKVPTEELAKFAITEAFDRGVFNITVVIK